MARRDFFESILRDTQPDRPPISDEELYELANLVLESSGEKNEWGQPLVSEEERGAAASILNLPDDGGDFGVDYETVKELERQKDWMRRDYSPEESVGNPLAAIGIPFGAITALPANAVTQLGGMLNDLMPLASATAPRIASETLSDMGKALQNNPSLINQIVGASAQVPEAALDLLTKGAGAEKAVTDVLGNVPLLGGAFRGMSNTPHEGDVRGSGSDARGFDRILELSEAVNEDGGTLFSAGRKARSTQSIPGVSAGLDTVANALIPAIPLKGLPPGVRALSDVPSTFILSGIGESVAKNGKKAVQFFKSLAPDDIRVKLDAGTPLSAAEQARLVQSTKDAYIASRGGRAVPENLDLTPKPPRPASAAALGDFGQDVVNRADVPRVDVTPEHPFSEGRVVANAAGSPADELDSRALQVLHSEILTYGGRLGLSPENSEKLADRITNEVLKSGSDIGTYQAKIRNALSSLAESPVGSSVVRQAPDDDNALRAVMDAAGKVRKAKSFPEVEVPVDEPSAQVPRQQVYPGRPDIGSPEDIARMNAEQEALRQAPASRFQAAQEKAISDRMESLRKGEAPSRTARLEDGSEIFERLPDDDFLTQEAMKRIGMSRESFEQLPTQLRSSARGVQFDPTKDFQGVIDEAVDRLDEFNYKVEFGSDGVPKVTVKEGFEPRGEATIWRDRLNAAIKARKGEGAQIPAVPKPGETYVRAGVRDIGTDTAYYAKNDDVADILRTKNLERKQFTGPSGENWAERNGNSKFFSDAEVKEYNTLIDEKGKKGWGGEKKARLAELEKKGRDAYRKENASASMDRASNVLEDKFQRSAWAEAANTASSIAGSPRAFQTTLDISYALRQGGFLKFSHPQAYARSLGNSIHAFGSGNYAEKALREIAEDMDGVLLNGKKVRFHDLAKGILTDTAADGDAFTKSSEELVNAGLVSQFPGIKNANNAFAVFGNQFRYNVLRARAKEWAASGMTEQKFYQNVETLKHWLNAATGRGDAPQWVLDRMFGSNSNTAYRALVHTMYSPRLTSSRFEVAAMAAQSLISNKAVHGITSRVPGLKKIVMPSEVADMILKDAAVGYTEMLATLGLMKWIKNVNNLDMDVEEDPRSDRFGQVRFGKNWYDFTIGHGDLFSIMAQVQSGEKLDSITRGTREADAANILLDFFRKKLSPEASMYRELGTDLPFQTGKDAIGRPGVRIGNVTKGQPFLYSSKDGSDKTGETFAKLYAPLGVQQFTDAAEAFGHNPELSGLNWWDALTTRAGSIKDAIAEEPVGVLGAVAADAVGVGSQVYDPTSSSAIILKEIQDRGYTTKDGKIPVRKNEVALDKDGNPVEQDTIWHQVELDMQPVIQEKKVEAYGESKIDRLEREAFEAEKEAEMAAHTTYYYYTQGQLPKEAFDKSLSDFLALVSKNRAEIRKAKEEDPEWEKRVRSAKGVKVPDDRYVDAEKAFFAFNDKAREMETKEEKDAVYEAQQEFLESLPEEISAWLEEKLNMKKTQLERDYRKDMNMTKKWTKIKETIEKESPIVHKYYAVSELLRDKSITEQQKKRLEAQRTELQRTPEMRAFFQLRNDWMSENRDAYEAGRFWYPDSYTYLEPRPASSSSSRSSSRTPSPAQRFSDAWRNVPTRF